jgi:hypothetical protein
MTAFGQTTFRRHFVPRFIASGSERNRRDGRVRSGGAVRGARQRRRTAVRAGRLRAARDLDVCVRGLDTMFGGEGQFPDGRSTWSITRVSTWPFADSSRNPSTSGSTVKIDSSAPGGGGGAFSGCDSPGDGRITSGRVRS